MICHETREYMFAFLDNELEASLSMELQHHIDHCAVCAREVEVERTIRDRLGDALKIQAPEEPFHIQAFERPPARGETFGGLRRWLSQHAARAACAAVILGAAVAYIVTQHGYVGDGHSGFVRLVVSDFEHFLEENRPIHFASSNADAISRWLLEQTNLEVVLPRVEGPNCRLLGARKCTIADRPAAFVVYEMDETPISLLAIASGSEGLQHMNQVESNGRIFWMDRLEDTSVLAYRQNNLVYAVVSKLAPPELINLFSGAEHESR